MARRKSLQDINNQYERMLSDYPNRILTQNRFNRMADARARYRENITRTRSFRRADARADRFDQQFFDVYGDTNAMNRASARLDEALRRRDGRRYNRSTYMGLNQG